MQPSWQEAVTSRLGASDSPIGRIWHNLAYHVMFPAQLNDLIGPFCCGKCCIWLTQPHRGSRVGLVGA